jgi:abortive infection bacteriophage resistance protein
MLKKSTSIQQQIQYLRDRGCLITDESLCEEVLSRISYYRMSAYFLPFKNADDTYKAGTDFADVYKLYELDRKLRNLTLSVAEEVEVCLKAKLSNYHAQKYGPDGYMDASNYSNDHKHDEFLLRINDLVESNKKQPFVRHHILTYDGKFPIWVMLELFTFGTMSYFYFDLARVDRKLIARTEYKTSDKLMTSWLRCCTVLRNMCAHSGRLYYTIFSCIPAGIPKLSKYSSRRLFGAIMALRALHCDDNKWNNEFLPSLVALLDEYSSVIDLKCIGFPVDWEDVLKK